MARGSDAWWPAPWPRYRLMQMQQAVQGGHSGLGFLRAALRGCVRQWRAARRRNAKAEEVRAAKEHVYAYIVLIRTYQQQQQRKEDRMAVNPLTFKSVFSVAGARKWLEQEATKQPARHWRFGHKPQGKQEEGLVGWVYREGIPGHDSSWYGMQLGGTLVVALGNRWPTGDGDTWVALRPRDILPLLEGL